MSRWKPATVTIGDSPCVTLKMYGCSWHGNRNNGGREDEGSTGDARDIPPSAFVFRASVHLSECHLQPSEEIKQINVLVIVSVLSTYFPVRFPQPTAGK